MSTDSEFGSRPTLPADLSDYGPLKPSEVNELEYAQLRRLFPTEESFKAFIAEMRRQKGLKP